MVSVDGAHQSDDVAGRYAALGLLGTGAPTVILLESVAFVVFTTMGLALAVRALDDAA